MAKALPAQVTVPTALALPFRNSLMLRPSVQVPDTLTAELIVAPDCGEVMTTDAAARTGTAGDINATTSKIGAKM